MVFLFYLNLLLPAVFKTKIWREKSTFLRSKLLRNQYSPANLLQMRFHWMETSKDFLTEFKI